MGWPVADLAADTTAALDMLGLLVLTVSPFRALVTEDVDVEVDVADPVWAVVMPTGCALFASGSVTPVAPLGGFPHGKLCPLCSVSTVSGSFCSRNADQTWSPAAVPYLALA